MKVAVTGASGFLGRYVVDNLVSRGVDTIATYRNDNDLAHWHRIGVRCVHFDLSMPLENCFKQLGEPDVLIHLAWGGLPNYRSLHHFETELPMQYRFLSTMLRGGLSALVTAGTCFEYGMQSGALTVEHETAPNNPYGYAKDALRKQLQFLQNTLSFRLTWARLFYMYGEGQHPSSLYPALKKAVSEGKQTFPMSGGEQLRDFLPVKEVAEQLVDLALNSTNSNVVNICSGKPISVRRLVEEWVKNNNWKIELELGKLPYPDYEPLAFWGVLNGK